jgi:ParB/RepB/Spo0J family partition protein
MRLHCHQSAKFRHKQPEGATMNTSNPPAAVAVSIHRNIALAQLFPSPTNPRKRFDEAKLKELAESIKTQGVLQPILVREILEGKASWPFPNVAPQTPSGRFEVIAGERRYRASKLAGLTEVPCFVRNLTDMQVLHAQVIENLQRDDLHPIEEAEGYEKLMQQQDDNGKLFTAESIGGEVGKSKAYIYARLKLLALCTEARQAFFDGDLDASTALLIARIPVQKLQAQALKEITRKLEYNTPNIAEGDNAMSFRKARDHIQENYMLDLADAPFEIEDAKLLAKTGACTECTKRTGNQPELFDDVKSKDVCTDTACFGLKKSAHVAVITKAAEANGDEVILGKDAKKILTQKWNIKYDLRNAKLAQLSDPIPDDAEKRTWEQALKSKKLLTPTKETGKPIVSKTLIENPFEVGIIETVDINAAMKALREAGFEIKPIAQAKQENSDNTYEKEQAKKKALVEQANASRKRLFDALRQQIAADMQKPQPYVADGLYRILAEACFEHMVGDYDDAAEIAKLYMPDAKQDDDIDLAEEFAKSIPSLTTQQHFLLIIDCMMFGDLLVNQWNLERSPDRMLAIAKEIGIDAEAIELEVIEEVKATQNAATKAAKTTKKEGAPA